ncbi:hydrogenase nickel incorporation protein HypB [Ancylobacter sp. FA202]|uniref:hydrogenase nickel incorporation protein HypB n=1 Tax=Ancylobacter sp. FA202 TaxID=1111106 RepID=UPI00037A6428|nr:hydrogenase nickel incorporation protein HypB [Ancylobacter sp. FA202]
MCVTCGCGPDEVLISDAHGAARNGGGGHHHPAHGHDHPHEHVHDEHVHDGHIHDTHGHAHSHGELVHAELHPHAHATPGEQRLVELEDRILAKNDAYAARNRTRFGAGGVFALNLLAGPGAGKTTLLVETLKALGGRVPAAVIEGDQQTQNDAERIRATGTPAVQVNTGKGCHLDAHMVGHALDELPLPPGGLLFIENVGNLVCPAAFDLGETRRVTLLSVTEGEDKPLKYPNIFETADLVLVTKVDLLPHLDIDMAAIERNIARVNPTAAILQCSSRGVPGLKAWLDWVADQRRQLLGTLAAEAERRAQALRASAGQAWGANGEATT